MASSTATEVEYVSKDSTVTRTTGQNDSGIGTSHDRNDSTSRTQQSNTIEQLSISEPSAADDVTNYPSGPKFWLLMSTIAAVLVLSSVDMNIVATAVPHITDHFHTVADVGWYASAFRLCQCAFQFLFGKAYKLFSVKRVFLAANAISVLGSLLCGASTTSRMLVVGRAVTGLGSAGLLSGCFVILLHSTPLRRRPMFTGLLGAVEGVATLAAPLLGGALTQTVGWRWCFYLNPPIGAVTLLLTLFCLTDPPKSEEIAAMPISRKIQELDLLSNLLFIPAMTALFIALSWAGTKYSWSSGEVIGPLVAFALLLAAFLYNQIRRGDSAALPPRILKRRSVAAGFFFIMCGNSTGNVLEYYLPTYYQIVRGYTPAKSGYLMLPIIIAATIGALIHGFGTSAFGYYAPFMLFASIIMPIAAGLITTFNVNTSFAQIILYTGFSGLAYGLGFSGPQNAVQTVLPAEDVPLGQSIMLFAQSFGPAVAVAIAQVLFTNQLSTNLRDIGPKMSGTTIESMGLSQILRSSPPDRMAETLSAINESFVHTWYLVVGLACATILGSVFTEWRSVKTRRD